MEHRVLTNASGKVMKHPISEQIIMPGQSYTEPADQESVELIDADAAVTVQSVADPKAFEKATRGVRGSSRQSSSDAAAGQGAGDAQ